MNMNCECFELRKEWSYLRDFFHVSHIFLNVGKLSSFGTLYVLLLLLCLQSSEKNFHGSLCPTDIFLWTFWPILPLWSNPCDILVNDIVNQVFPAVLTLLKRDCLKLSDSYCLNILFLFMAPPLQWEVLSLHSAPCTLWFHDLCYCWVIENYCGN